jgi:hypothetical protein
VDQVEQTHRQDQTQAALEAAEAAEERQVELIVLAEMMVR